MSSSLDMIRQFGHEEVAFFNNDKVGLKCIIAIHNTNLGPAVGGCRLNPYESEDLNRAEGHWMKRRERF